ncbi:MAG: hypothetical protein NZ843_07015 [Fimbriimonadales bacterium]|nr:hypothetical protein [Fimbriimonadales bacterium]
MRRLNWLFGALTIATTLAQLTPSAAQPQQECCSFYVSHHFKLCLPQGCQQPQVQWNWNTFAAAWNLNNLPPIINTNSGSATYSIPSSDAKCASVQIPPPGQQVCAIAQACAGFNVDWIQGTTCIQGSHYAFGRACANCARHGANAGANSHIVIACPGVSPNGVIVWAPQFQDFVGGECGVQTYDPVILRLRNPRTGDRMEITLFSLEASGMNWNAQDTDGDGFPDNARLKGSGPIRGNITLLKRTAGPQGGESQIRIRYENGIVTESIATGEFARLQLPAVGSPMPGPNDEGIAVPASFDLPIAGPSGWVLDGIEMGGGGQAGDPLPRVEGDVNGDGCVDDADLLIVLFNFGNQGGTGDVNGDGIVDDADLLTVLFNFGRGC